MSEEKREKRFKVWKVSTIAAGLFFWGILILWGYSVIRMAIAVTLEETLSERTIFFLLGQGSIISLLVLFVGTPFAWRRFKKWRAWRRRIIKDDRPPTVQEIHEAMLDAIERLTGRRPNTTEIQFPGTPPEFLPKFNPGPPYGSA